MEDMFVEDEDAQTTSSEDSKMKDAGSTVTLNGYANSELEDNDIKNEENNFLRLWDARPYCNVCLFNIEQVMIRMVSITL